MSKTTTTAEISKIEVYLSAKASTYDFDADYKDAERRLMRLKNPAGNYWVARRSAVSHYLGGRGNAGREFLSWARKMGLAELAQIKVEFAGLIVKGA